MTTAVIMIVSPTHWCSGVGLHHADGGDDAVEAEDDVEDQDLRDDAGERRGGLARAGAVLLAFELVVDLVVAL